MDKSLNKYISETGFCSRREADKYIEQARVTINDKIAIKGNRVMPGDTVEIDGEPIKKKDKTVYLVFNKPVGITCTTDLKDKNNIISFINFKSRIFPIGRLDKPSEGLIFLTNDGDIVNKILRAGNNHEKEYVVTVDKPISGDFVNKMSTQGLNRQIRRMCLALGYNVNTLKRVRIMNITLANLPIGKWRNFTEAEIKTMDQLVADSSKTADHTNYLNADLQE
ncbi:MAG: 23S rRNA pseudouridine synthase F [Chitinophagia bacterium]|nr:23S rRNA pseudouridine synthase F [Chitinophagia bacterium]